MRHRDRSAQSKTKVTAPPPVNTRAWRLTLAIVALALAGAALRIAAVDDGLSRTPDEQLYTFQAQAVALHGFEGTRRLVKGHELERGMWILPPPSRVGYLWIRAGVMRLTDVWDERSGVYLSCACGILTLALIAFLGLRYFDPWVTLLALAFACASLADLAIARRAWQDSVFGLFGAASMALAFEVRRRAGALAWCCAFAAVSAYSVLIKESGVLVYALWLGWLLWFFAKQRAWRKAAGLLGAALVSTVLTLWVWSAALGGWDALLGVYLRHAIGYTTNPYAAQFCSGPWYRFLFGAFLMAPLPLILFAFAAVWAFLRSRDPLAVGMALLCVVLFIPAALPNSQSYRYLTPAFAAFYLLAGKGARDLLALARARLKASSYEAALAVTCVLVAFNAFTGYQNLNRMDRVNQARDLAVKMVLDALP